MKTIYKILDPTLGGYKDAATLEECQQLFAQTAFDFYMHHVHGVPYSICEVADDGSEVWRSPSGDEITPAFKDQIAVQLQAIAPTPVEEMP